MPTEKRYLEYPDLFETDAEVLSCAPSGENYWVVTNRTVLFPEGGGQLCDHGTIDGAEIFRVEEADGAVRHLCAREFRPGQRVTLRADPETRLDHSIQHTGEHMISHAFYALYGIKNIGFHMSDEVVTIDLDAEVTDAQLRAAEDYANCQIWENRRVSIIERRDGDLGDLPMRKATEKVKGLLRIVLIEGGDACTCCGTHVSSAGQVGLIKIIKADRHRGGMRLEIVCGARALRDYQKKDALAAALRAGLSTDDIAGSVERLKTENRELSLKLRQATARLMDLRAREVLADSQTADGLSLAFTLLEGGADEATQLLSALLGHEKTLAGVFYADGERLGYMISKTPDLSVSCRALADTANRLFGARGGGNDLLAQGAGPMPGDVQSLVEKLRDAAARMFQPPAN